MACDRHQLREIAIAHTSFFYFFNNCNNFFNLGKKTMMYWMLFLCKGTPCMCSNKND